MSRWLHWHPILLLASLRLSFVGVYAKCEGPPGPWDCVITDAVFNHAGFAPHSCYDLATGGIPQFANNLDFASKEKSINDYFATYTGDHSSVYKNATEKLPTNLTVYAMEYKGRPLYGWLHVVLTSQNVTGLPLEKVFIQVETEENSNAPAGSIVELQVTGSCASQGGTPKEDYRPCTVAIDPFPEVYTAFSRGLNTTSLKEYQFNVKLGFPVCSIYHDKNPIFFRTYVMGGQTRKFYYGELNLPYQQRIFLEEYVFGAADPAPPARANGDDLKCTTAVAAGKPSWVKNVGPSSYNVTIFDHSCSHLMILDKISWGGRCNTGYDPNYSGRKQHHVHNTSFRYHCRRFANAQIPFGTPPPNGFLYDVPPLDPEKWSKQYPEINVYYAEIANALEAEGDSGICKSCGTYVQDLKKKGLDASTEIGRYIWGGRQAHGVLMAIACLFVYPVSNFVTRYFKGSYMTSRAIINLHVWYSVHVYGIMTVLTLCAVSLGIAINTRKYLGYSLTAAGKTHVYIGYLSLLLFLVDFIYSAVRCGEVFGRNCTILFHFLLGGGFYFTSLVAIITSIYVPGSPGSLKDELKDAVDTGKFILLAVVVQVWPIFEVVIHLLATIQLCRIDNGSGILRDWAFLLVPIPRVAAQELEDEPGTTIRAWLLRLFIICSLGATCIAVFAISVAEAKGHLLGQMSLTHVNGDFTDAYVGLFYDFDNLL